METIQTESIRANRDNTEQEHKQLTTARDRFRQLGTISESDFSVTDSIEFRKIVLDFIDENLKSKEFVIDELETHLSIYSDI